MNINFDESTKMGDIRKLAKEIKVNHDLAIQIWQSGKFHERLLSILIMDKKLLTEEMVSGLIKDMEKHTEDQQLQLMDWLFANQLTKTKQGISWILSWENSSQPLKRRTFWYYQGRLRWMGKTDFADTEDLLAKIESKLLDEVPMVQWAMNFVAGWIGVFEDQYKERCIALGERTGLYKDEIVHRGCTPNYLPGFIEVERSKRQL